MRLKGILEHVAAVLEEAKGALDIQLLCQELVKRGVLPDAEAKSRHHTYTRIFMDISNRGEDSRFRKVGRGVFALSTHIGEDGEARLGEGIRVAGSNDGSRKCGNCNYLTYPGVHELTMFGGYCEAEGSGRHYTRRNQEPCACWRKRSLDKVAGDRKRKEDLRVKVHIANLKLRGPRYHRG